MQIVDAPIVPSKFLHLKMLSIHIHKWSLGREYDFLSLVSFLDASPSLETFSLSVSHCSSCHDLLFSKRGGIINSSSSAIYLSGISAIKVWLDFWRPINSEATAGTPPWQAQDCVDQWFLPPKELGWADTAYSRECNVTEAPYINHHWCEISVLWPHPCQEMPYPGQGVYQGGVGDDQGCEDVHWRESSIYS